MTLTEEAVTAADLARILRISVSKVYRLARNNDIPGMKIGTIWRFFPEQVIDSMTKPKNRDPWAQSTRSQGRRRVA